MKTQDINTHYVYIYCDPRKQGSFKYDDLDFTFNYEPFYIGSGKGYRWKRHLTNFELDWNYNTIKNGKIKHIINEGLDLSKYVIFYKTNLSKQEALNIEINLIRFIGRIVKENGPLSNIDDGYGSSVLEFSTKNKGKTYEEIYGLEKSLELKEKRRNQLKGNTYGSVTKGVKRSQYVKNILSEYHSKELKQMDYNFNVIKIWKNAIEAAMSLNLSKSSIHNVLGGGRSKTAGGYYWEYVNEENKKYKQLKLNING